ncbi:S1 family peptidase [Nocardiopsis sp. NPDC101807]|uniref:S1 family peptidase n=1 Tax=Nocardiopsis sp. NPDC101807 TaxID=3364339 RepID=UPI0037FBF2A1
MRPSPVISAIGTGALAFGLAFSVTPGATAAAVPAEPASGGSATMLEALERDLGLTPFGAEALLEAQESAFATDTEATEAAGDAYGGSLFDPETQELTVLVTDAAAVDAVEAAGAEATVVSYGTEGLAQVVDELDAVGAPEGVVGWYPDVERDTVVIQVTEGASADGLIEASGVDASAFEVQETVEAPRLLAEIVGGEAYHMGGGGRCSIGFAVQGGFVTAGHCGTVGTTAESSDGTGSGVFEESVFPGSDGAYVAATSDWTGTNRVEGSSSTVSGSTQAPIGSAVCRSGSTTGWHCGTIEARGQTVSYPEGTVEDLTRTDVCAEPGDSGGSFISGSQAQGVTSGGSGDCTSGGTTYYQEVGPLLSSWGLSLVTG